MTTYTVSSSTELLSTLKSISAGDTILLAGGTYSGNLIRGIDTSNVTITSADPGNLATFTDLTVRNSSGLTFSNINLTAPGAKDYQTFLVHGSNDIHFDRVEVSGPGIDVRETSASPFFIRASANISVTNSEFHHLWHGINLLDSKDVVISGNSFHDIRTDGVRGGGNSDIVIDGNLFTDFYPAIGDHADAIQLWTTNTSLVARDVVISNNAIVRGDGDVLQGIFIRDTFDTLPFENLSIIGNLVIGGNYNGIAVDGAIGGVIRGNTVLGLSDQRSWIRTVMTQDFAVSGNVGTYYLTEASTKGVLIGNILTAPPIDAGIAAIAEWLAAHPNFAGAWGDPAAAALALGVILSGPPAEVPPIAPTLPAVPTEPEQPVAEKPSVTPKPTAPPAPTAPAAKVVLGTGGIDRLKTVNGHDTRIEAGDGNDALTGGATGSNTLLGGKGDDTYTITSANNVVVELGGEGTDTVAASIDYWLPDNVENLRLIAPGLTGVGNALDNRLVGSSGSDRLFGMDGNDTIQGVDGDDWISGGNGDDDLRGDGGDDVIHGDAGNDLLYGGAGNDILSGGAGDDILEGGIGSDVMGGGQGADTFRFRNTDVDGSIDTITDFQPGIDKIALNLIDADASTAKDDKFRFIGQQGFSKTAGELRFEIQGSDLHVTGDVNGDAIADFTIVLRGLQTIAADNFVL